MKAFCPVAPVPTDDDNQFIKDSIEMGVEHWEDEIDFLQARLRGEQGDIDEEDRVACEEALAIARENLADAVKRRS